MTMPLTVENSVKPTHSSPISANTVDGIEKDHQAIPTVAAGIVGMEAVILEVVVLMVVVVVLTVVVMVGVAMGVGVDPMEAAIVGVMTWTISASTNQISRTFPLLRRISTSSILPSQHAATVTWRTIDSDAISTSRDTVSQSLWKHLKRPPFLVCGLQGWRYGVFIARIESSAMLQFCGAPYHPRTTTQTMCCTRSPRQALRNQHPFRHRDGQWHCSVVI